MSTSSPLAEPATWDLVAADYTTDIAPFFARYAARALDVAGVHHGTTAHVVDVAAGPGTLAFLAAERGASVAALDFSEQMVVHLRAGLGPRADRIAVHHGDGQALPFPDTHFDAGFSMFGLMFFPDRRRGLSELLRVLRPGGTAVISSWAPMDAIPLMAAAFGALRDHVPGLPPPPARLPLAAQDDCYAELRDAGFQSVDVHAWAETQTLPGVAHFWQRMTRNNAVVATLRTRLGQAWAPVALAVEERLVRDFGSGPIEIAYTALISSGRRPVPASAAPVVGHP